VERPALLVIGGIDPTGRAGLARDLAACRNWDVAGCPVATGLTVQTSAGVDRIEPTPPDVIVAMIDAAIAERAPRWAKVGAVFSLEQALAIADAAGRHGLRLVVDPILRATSGAGFASPETLRPLVEAATLVTPNEDEAARLGLRDGGRVHVTRGGDAPGRHRGTGCRFAANLACLLALDLDRDAALDAAHRAVEAEVRLEADEQALDPARRKHLEAARRALPRILADLEPTHVPEVGMNFAWAMAGATEPRRDVAGLAGRITIAGFDRAVAGRVAIGGPHHTGRLAVVLQEYDGPGTRRAGEACIVLNHRFDDAFLEAAQRAALVDAGFRREDEPPEAPSSMEWGLRDAIARNGGRVPDLVWDRGGPGKEAMLRVIAPDVEGLVARLRALHAVDRAVLDADGRQVR